ncbi:uncharacterized protein N7515_003404 [Penicillium bovifimosum]|uniref:NmrA-like domain-containing protein n=1 Tax=Penicillium bovifimosum TaxID=126998 RepID=A0A9W9L5Q8_9EURO|nr:uncharacterized protein N7515_003404 [Penicillium bovifimosum]KAJ5138556.1 hypothetical protein N7515_003404 [Penicillium bovifimosum]
MTPTAKPVVAIAGATGHLGKHITSAFLSSAFHDKFSEIILLSRKESTLFSPTEVRAGVKVTTRRYDTSNLSQALQGVHILVNAIGPSGHEFKTRIAATLPRTNIRLYFPSEFGVDHYGHDFAHLEWYEKKKHLANAQPVVTDMKICRVFCGLFLEDSIGPWFGLDTKNGRYTSVGPPTKPVSFTGIGDVGKTVAALATMEVDMVPEIVHVGGDTRSVLEIAGIMRDAGAGEIEVSEVPYEEYKKKTTGGEASWDPAAYLRFLMADGSIDHTVNGLGSDNEFVNPGQRLWKWKTMEELAKETKGRPWKDTVWPPK